MWQRLSWRVRGYLITGAGVMLLSPDALFVKDTQLDVAAFMFWRALLLFAVLSLVAWWRYGKRLPEAVRACGPAMWWCPLAFAVSAWGFVAANRLTAAGNVLVIQNLAPLLAGLIGLVVYGQRLRLQTWCVIVLCVLGASLMAVGELGAGSPLGLVVALAVPLAIAVNTTVASAQRGVDTTVILPLGCLVILIPAIAMGGMILPSLADLQRLALLALVFLPGAYLLIQTGPRYLPGAEVSLVMLLETFVGTLLVWWWLGEVPPPLAFVGGAVIVTALLGSGALDLYRQRRKVAAGAPDPCQAVSPAVKGVLDTRSQGVVLLDGE
ncbi:membrane protein [Litchfieldella qijiaojingensis]|uniref:Membrane protein n=1 Tax=Litchfieldella qijiaojingensis TaxID=980347 RepID=A0ABQ2Z0N6_9GAMM|nr:DMT family transporter [Halomonas qijiaojingensis]GGY00872.1 membrane protein [Halomonas qijiaojingensis]